MTSQLNQLHATGPRCFVSYGHVVFFFFFFFFLADTFIQSDLQMRTIEAFKPTKEQNMQVR